MTGDWPCLAGGQRSSITAVFDVEDRIDSIEAQLFASERLRFKEERKIARYTADVDAAVKRMGELAEEESEDDWLAASQPSQHELSQRSQGFGLR